MEENTSFSKRPYGFFPTKSQAFLVIGTIVTVIPVALFLWLGNVAVSFFSADDTDSQEEIISPSRWLTATLIPSTFAIWGYRRKSVNFSGALLGWIFSFILSLSSYPFLACLIAFFLSGSQATKFRADKKRKFEENFKPGGHRNWVQVLCNGGAPTFMAVLYIIDCGVGETPIDFDNSYHASMISMAVLGSFAAACGDTWSSELGSVIQSAQPVLITNLKPVPRGTNGGVTGPGLWFSFIGGLLVGFAHYITLVNTVDPTLLERAPAQWPVVFVGGIAGFLGSVLDSYLGAIFQYSGVHKSGVIVEHSGDGITHISGKEMLDNHSVNLICTIAMGLITPKIANCMWTG
ncbi:transmembrane protein 19 [Planococcus citri]|uniref:transmembrane protein 19 n=1 Tax=Planococcus citri TaxID=170843 RepID=UPI0031F78D16